MKHLASILLLFTSLSLLGQGEANNWYFGQNAGLNFSTTPPTALTNGQLNTLEGCTTISDANGALLFYTDGSVIYTRNHTPMQNGTGLLGDSSSTSSALIVPQPNTPNIYIVFTVDEPHHLNADNDVNTIDGDGVNNGFAYSVVDMTLDNGNGGVISGQKNISLITYDTSDTLESLYKCSEKITAVKSDDCNSFWVITHFIDTFYAFAIDQTGINITPVTSKVGVTVPVSGYRRNALGYMKTSPEGDKLGVAHLGLATQTAGDGPGKVLLYDFNNSTGIVSNELELYNGDAPYGIEFSQSGQRLYTTIGIGDAGIDFGFVMQFDLSLPVNQIAASGTRLLNEISQDSSDFSAGALQLGPDGKIYRALYNFTNDQGNYLGVIENPEEVASNIIYKEQGVLVNTDGLRSSQVGLPPFIQSIFSQTVDIINNGDPTNTNLILCDVNTYRLEYQDIMGATYSWFKDNVPIANTSFFLDIIDSANYRVEIDLNDGSCPLIGVANVTFVPLPVANDSSITQCDTYVDPDDGITLFNLTELTDQITDSSTDRTVLFFSDMMSAQNGFPEITNPEAYENTSVQQLFTRVIDNITGCYDIATVDLLISNNTANDAILELCDDDGIEDGLREFDLTVADSQVLLGITDPNLSVMYYATNIDALNKVNAISTFTNTTPYTQNQEIVYARVEDNQNRCYGINTVELLLSPLPDIEETEEIILCQDETIEINSGLQSGISSNTFNYLWSTGETTEQITVTEEGTYTVTVINKNTLCTKERTVTVILSKPAVIQQPIVIQDATSNNTVTINLVEPGDYDFAIAFNDSNIRTYQDSPVFNNVPSGFHTVYVRNKNGCGEEVTQEISVVGFPAFFTPNGDSFNQTWNVDGISAQVIGNSRIFIFDRHGKLIKQLMANGNGWDGTYSGQPMPSNEYWFRVELEDGRIAKGSFSLIR
ncbi:hypothetical protein GCM10022393_22340 [Aquimarina addita]|uniref:Gliding motility-associated C-terminal domain-containing protein n=1 Tax=Aquimarina addita TaxID=870485 RepID=A0ABP6UKG4_9FLAO